MAVTDFVKFPIEGTLYYNLDYDADENIVAGWVECEYVTDFNVNEDPGSQEYYKKYDLQPAKKGRSTNDGSLTQSFTNYNDSLYKLAVNNTCVALKVEIADDGTGPATEVVYFSTVNFKKRSFKFGNLNDNGDPMSASIDFRYASSKFYQVP